MGERDTLTTVIVLGIIGIPLVLICAVFFGDVLSHHLGKAALGGLVLLAIGALIKGISMTYKSAMFALRKEAELAILEELSHGSSLSRKALLAHIRKTNWVFHLFGGFAISALRRLHESDLVVLSNGKYSAKESKVKQEGHSRNPGNRNRV